MPTLIPFSAFLLHIQDFSQGDISAWTMDENWGVVLDGNNLVLQRRASRGGSYAITGTNNWQNYALSLRVKLTQNDKGTIYIRTHSRGDNQPKLIVAFDFANRFIRLFETTNSGIREVTSRRMINSIQLGEWATLQINVEGRQIEVWVNDQSMFNRELTIAHRGRVEIGVSSNTAALFDDIAVWQLR